MKSKGAKAIGVINVVDSSIARESDGVAYIQAGPEIGVASTKAYTLQVLTITLLAIYFAEIRGTASPEELRKLKEALLRLPEQAEELLSREDAIIEVAKKHFEKPSSLYLARGINLPSAMEGSLKLKEISYIHAEAYSAGEMKHGPIALVEPNMFVVAIACEGPTYDEMVANIMEIKARSGPVIAVSYDGGVTSDYSEYPVIADGHLEGMTGYSDGLVGIGTRANGTIPTLWVFSASDQGVQEVPLTSKLLSDGKELGLCASDAEDVWATTPDALLRIRLDTGDVVVERSWEQPRDDLRVGCALLEDGSLVVLEGDQVLRRDDDMTWSEFFSGRATTVYDQAGSYWVTTIAEKIGDTVIWHRSHGEPTWAPFLQADAAFEYPSACGASHAQLCGDAREAMELALGVGQPEDALGEYPDTVTARQVGCSTSGQQGPLGAGAAMGLLVFLVVTRRPAKIW